MDKKLEAAARAYHALPQPGKIEVRPTKSHNTQQDLTLAYSPGVAVPCKDIEADPELAYDYTSKGNLVAVISNGTAVLGLGKMCIRDRVWTWRCCGSGALFGLRTRYPRSC